MCRACTTTSHRSQEEELTQKVITNKTALLSGASATMGSHKITDPTQLRVLIFTPSYHIIDGVTLTLRKVRAEVEAQGGLVKIVTAVDAKKAMGDDPGMIYFPCLSLPYDSNQPYSICRMLTKDTQQQILDFKPNVLHVTAPDPLCMDVAKFGRENSMGIMATWHSNIPDYMEHMGWFQKHILKPIIIYIFKAQYSYCPVTFVPQPKLVDAMRETGYESSVTRNQLKVWGRGVDTDLFSPSKRSNDFRAKHGVAEDEVVVLWVGRVVNEKNTAAWEYTMRKLTEKYPNKVKGWVLGAGEDYDSMVSVPNVTGFGHCSQAGLADFYANSDILLFPSAVETFGNVTLEAMSSGLPCIVDETCSSFLVENGKIGFTVQTPSKLDDEDEEISHQRYYKATERLVLDEKMRKEMSVAARNCAEEKWKLKVIMNQMVENYIDVANYSDEDLAPFIPTFRHRFAYGLYSLIDLGGPAVMWFIGIMCFYSENIFMQAFLFGGIIGGIYAMYLFIACLLGLFSVF